MALRLALEFRLDSRLRLSLRKRSAFCAFRRVDGEDGWFYSGGRRARLTGLRPVAGRTASCSVYWSIRLSLKKAVVSDRRIARRKTEGSGAQQTLPWAGRHPLLCVCAIKKAASSCAAVLCDGRHGYSSHAPARGNAGLSIRSSNAPHPGFLPSIHRSPRRTNGLREPCELSPSRLTDRKYTIWKPSN